MKSQLKTFVGELLIRCLRIPFFDRLAGFIAFQRRRKTRRHFEDRLRADGNFPDEVHAGPFKGTKFPPAPHWICSRFEKTFGAYEPEWFTLIEKLASNPDRYRSLINVGAADGFYVCGMARLFPAATVIAFEKEEYKHPTLNEIVKLNALENRADIRGACDPKALNDLDCPLPALLICDVDGYEDILLDPQHIELLKRLDLLIETHNFYVRGITDTLVQRFEASHAISRIEMTGVDYSTIPQLAGLSMHEVESMVGSERSDLHAWLFLKSNVNPSDSSEQTF